MSDLFSQFECGWLDLLGTAQCFSVNNQFVGQAEADCLFADLHQNLEWQTEFLTIYGREVMSPRKVAWYGDPSSCYQYSGKYYDPLPWYKTLESLRRRVQRETGNRFNSVLANLYRDGHDSVGWHRDNEVELGDQPVIASLSFGATRFFDYRRVEDHADKHRVELTHGSLLVMKNDSQKLWQHQVPKQKKIKQPRINLTFRWVHQN